MNLRFATAHENLLFSEEYQIQGRTTMLLTFTRSMSGHGWEINLSKLLLQKSIPQK
jgi:hypothetical protein